MGELAKEKQKKSGKLPLRFSSDDWSEVGDLIDQCIEAADIDGSYSRHVRDKAMEMMTLIRNKAVDNGLYKKTNGGLQS